MRIDTPQRRGAGWSALRRLPGVLRRPAVAIAVVVVAAYVAGVVSHRSGLVGDVVDAARDLRRIPTQLAARSVEPEHITIDIKHKHVLRLAYQRERAVAAGLLVTTGDDYVPATIRHGDETVPVKLRLKGDLKDHWTGDKWSFRIVTRGDRTLFGMKQFSIQRPDARNYVAEWLYHTSLAREGLPAIRYSFVSVTLNGDAKGIYALEEHFEKRLIENSRLREGPIVRFNEDLFWTDIRDQGGLAQNPGAATHSGTGSFLASEVDGFRSSKWLADPDKRGQYIEAVRILDAFRSGEMAASEVFDVPKLGIFLALSDLHNAQHAAHWRNIRFYYNPVTARLEPIGFDGTMIYERFRGLLPTLPYVYEEARFHSRFYERIFSDSAVMSSYVAAVERVSQTSYVDSLLSDVGAELERNLRILQQDYPELTFSRAGLDRIQRSMRAAVAPVVGVRAHRASSSTERLDLAVANLQYLPVEVVGISIAGNRIDLAEPLRLPALAPGELPSYSPLAVAAALSTDAGDVGMDLVTVHHRVVGASVERSCGVLDYAPGGRRLVESFTRRAPNVSDHEFLKTDQERHEIRVVPGQWTVRDDVIVPPGYRLVVYAGTVLELTGNASIVSRSPLDFRGEPGEPIVVRGSEDGSGGVFVLQAGERSVLRHTLFERLRAPVDSGATLTGAVTFYESPVNFESCHFVDARAEDALNVVRTQFELRDCAFRAAASDAFDADFCEGQIIDGDFRSSANDAVDVSGSAVTIERLRVEDCGDKAVSAGEDSHVTATGVVIVSSVVGVASKDSSHVRMRGVRLEDVRIGLAAYRKKPEFGPASIEAFGVRTSAVDEIHWIEEGSSAVIDRENVEGSRTDPRPVFYPDE